MVAWPANGVGLMTRAHSLTSKTEANHIRSPAWRNANCFIGNLAEHFRGVHRLYPRSGHLEDAVAVQAHRVLDGKGPFRHVFVVGTESLERPLLENRPDPALPLFAPSREPRVTAETRTEDGGAGGNRVVDDDPRHVGLCFDLESHAHDVPLAPGALRLPFDRRQGLFDAVAARERLLERNRRETLDGHPGL